jgi:hypothetical protein
VSAGSAAARGKLDSLLDLFNHRSASKVLTPVRLAGATARLRRFSLSESAPSLGADVLAAEMQPADQGMVIVVHHICSELAAARQDERLRHELHGYGPPRRAAAAWGTGDVIPNKDE